MKTKHPQTGFTLPEVIVAISVLIMVIVACTNLLVSIIRNNSENIDSLIGYGLAQQGLEGVRNIRDSNWLLNADFSGHIGPKKNLVWGGQLPPTIDHAHYYTLDLQPELGSCNNDSTYDSAAIVQCAPWILQELGTDEPEFFDNKTQLYTQPENLPIQYLHAQTRNSKASPFHRYLKVSPLSHELAKGEVVKYRVTVVVSWKGASSREKDLRLTTELTDWKGGPL